MPTNCKKCGRTAGAELVVESRNGKTLYYYSCSPCRTATVVAGASATVDDNEEEPT